MVSGNKTILIELQKLEELSIKLRQLANRDDTSYDKNWEIRKMQNEVYKKKNFYKKLLEAQNEIKRVQENKATRSR